MTLATWVGPYDALLVTGGILRVGDTYDVTDEDLKSAHWTVETSPAPDAPVAPAPTITTPGSAS